MTPRRLALYIEDNAVNVRLVEKIVQLRPQISLTVAGTGERGLELAAESPPDLILLDWRLPKLQGSDVLRHLKATAATTHIPVVVFSGDSGRDQVAAIMRLGATQFLPKPFVIDQLLAVLDTFCGETR